MIRLSRLPAPALAGVVKAKNTLAAIAEIKNCFCDGATMIDLHLPYLAHSDTESLKKIVSASRLPILALNYSKAGDDGDLDAAEAERVESLLRAVEAGAAGIDMQGYTFHRPSRDAFCGENKYSFTQNAPKEVVTDTAVIDKQCALIEQVHQKGAEVLLSCHPAVFMSCEQAVELALFLEKRNPDIIKIVVGGADTEEQMAEVFSTMIALKKEVRTPVSYHANGKCGMLTRIVNPLLGGKIAFCVDRYDEYSTMDQLDLRATAAILENIKKIM